MASVSDPTNGSASGESERPAEVPACSAPAVSSGAGATSAGNIPQIVGVDATRVDVLATSLALDLPPEQRVALALLIDGKSVTLAAHTAGVSRQAIYNWRHTDVRFMAAMNLWRRQAKQSVGDGMALLSEKAMSVLAAALEKNDLSAARIVLNFMQRARVGSGNAEKVARRLDVRRRLRQVAEAELESREESATAPKPPPAALRPPAPPPMKVAGIKALLKQFSG